MTRARSVARLGNSQAFNVDSSLNVGINSTSPVEKLNVVGVVSATSFFGDGSSLSGISVDSTSLKDSGGNIKVQANPNGIVVTGVTTSTSFSGNVTGNASGTAGGLSGTPDITVNNTTGAAATFTTLQATTYIGIPPSGVDITSCLFT
tara:strand:+ start:25 stop:468 length:444 start_codon:yes stop_codon:yes gene_type:complete